MKISHKWLSEFVQLDQSWTPERVSEVLTDLGLEVEHIDDQARTLDRFVVGYVISCEKHPKADKLTVCSVDVGEAEPRTICCGAPNVAAGQFVPVALDGAVVPNGGFTIAKRQLRGVDSNGMICSRAELGYEDSGTGIWELGTSTQPPTTNHQPGTALAEFVGATDVIYDVAITPNRADCNSHVGIARDLAAYLSVASGEQQVASIKQQVASSEQLATHALRASDNEPPLKPGLLSVDAVLAPRYALQRISNVRIVPSPEWMQERLRAVGVRPRNIVVDATNYVNMELGQPLHAFDAKKLRGGAIQVKTATAGETFTTLDGKERTLDAEMLMICDAEGPVAIAGVMGGQNSEIDDNTTDIVLESAYFDPRSIRRTAKKLGLNTDASYRFERGIDIGNVLGALQRAVDLIVEFSGGIPSEVVEQYPAPFQQAVVRCRYARMRDVNGIDVDDATINLMLTSIGCEVVSEDAESVTVRIPTWRVDITAEIDLAEEVMRLYGINNVPSAEYGRVNMTGNTLHPSTRAVGGRQELLTRNAIRTKLVARGYTDCITSVLTSPETAAIGGGAVVTLKNALGSESSALRTSLIPGLLVSASRNLRHGAGNVRLMEIGQVFAHAPTAELGVEQQERLVLLSAGTTGRHWSAPEREIDLYDVLGDLGVVDSIQVAPAQGPADGVWSVNTVDVFINGVKVGKAGELESALCKAFDLSAAYAADVDVRGILRASITRVKKYVPVGQYPTVQRDLALIVSEGVQAGSLVEVVGKNAGENYRGAEVFDVFRDEQHVGAGMKSVAVNITFRSDERTLVDEEIDASVRAIIDGAKRELGARVRGGDDPSRSEGQ